MKSHAVILTVAKLKESITYKSIPTELWNPVKWKPFLILLQIYTNYCKKISQWGKYLLYISKVNLNIYF